MFGQVLKNNLYRLSSCSTSKSGPNTFWVILRDIAVEEIKAMAPYAVDSDIAIGVYYDILASNSSSFPRYYSEKLNNKQERFRVANRNMWSSNAFHPDGLANQPGISAHYEINPSKKGSKIVYKWEGR